MMRLPSKTGPVSKRRAEQEPFGFDRFPAAEKKPAEAQAFLDAGEPAFGYVPLILRD